VPEDNLMAIALKLGVAWVGAVLGAVTLQHIVMLATLIYTLLQIYLLWRDRIRARKGGKQ